MNIFVLDLDPHKAAIYQCDKHIVKMVTESAQLLCYAFWHNGIEAPYKMSKGHSSHPCTLWTKRSYENFCWLLDHARAQAIEYTYRYGRRIKSEDVIDWCCRNIARLSFDEESLTPFALAMPEQYRSDDPVESYRNYYRHDKVRFARWNKSRPSPNWMTEGSNAIASETQSVTTRSRVRRARIARKAIPSGS